MPSFATTFAASSLFASVLLTPACRHADKASGSPAQVRIAVPNTPLPYLPVFLAEALGSILRASLVSTYGIFRGLRANR